MRENHVYRLEEYASSFLDIYVHEECGPVMGIIPVTKTFLEASVVCLRTVCQASEEDTSRYIQMLYQQQISVSTISNICQKYGKIANDWNLQVSLKNVHIGANDEIFFGRAQRQMILAGVCLQSTYVYGAAISEDRKAETWQLFMMLLQNQGLQLDVSISDAGASLIKGIQDTYDKCFIQLDVFHTIKDLGEPCLQLERKAYSLLGEMYEKERTLMGPKPHKKTREQYEDMKQNIDGILSLVDQILILYTWARELLDFTGHSRYETEMMLRWIVDGMRELIDQGKTYNSIISLSKIKHAVDIFANRIVKSLSFIDFLIMNLDNASDDLGVDPSAAHLLYRMRAFLPESDEYGFMSKRVNNLLQGTGVSRGTLEKVVQNIVANAHKASSMIENVNSRLRTALNDSRGMTSMYLALLILFINTKEYRRSAIPERKGKSPYELLTGEKISFMEILFPDFHPVLPLWKAHSKARMKAS